MGLRSRPQARVVLVVTGCALVLHLLWFRFLAGTGGDLAAQDAWTGFALAHPTSAYDFAWYGGMHPASYSLISPYVMSVLGVRTTMLVVGTVSAALVTILLSRLPRVAHPGWAGLYAAVALTGNAVSGRVTFGLGLALGLGAMAVVFAWPRGRQGRFELWGRGVLACLLAGLATAASPVAGLFLGLVAAALWLVGRRRASLAVGVLPVAIVLGTAVLFPFFGIQPFSWRTALAPLLLACACWFLLPRGWRLGRMLASVYAGTVLLVWALPTPIGTNVTRLSLLFGGVTLVAAASGAWWTSPAARRFGRPVGGLLLVTAILTSTAWQAVIAGQDVLGSASASVLDADVQPLVAQLDARGANQGRVEVVPSKNHGEASALAPYVNLARGWNRQADVARNPMFYRDERPFSASQYQKWLRDWAVRFVVLPASTPDYAALRERKLVRAGLPFLQRVWSDSTWTLYEVIDPAPMITAPAVLVSWDSAGVTVQMPVAGSTVLRIAWSPWLSIVDENGRRIDGADLDGSCLKPLPAKRSRHVAWVVLEATQPGTYRIQAPYAVPRGTLCVE
ncbi:MAG: hypothetical protein QOD98_2175 [Nocardioidaceae bacterium]|nr:hypothetical protein [Nocardioidaceae bacterium]